MPKRIRVATLTTVASLPGCMIGTGEWGCYVKCGCYGEEQSSHMSVKCSRMGERSSTAIGTTSVTGLSSWMFLAPSLAVGTREAVVIVCGSLGGGLGGGCLSLSWGECRSRQRWFIFGHMVGDQHFDNVTGRYGYSC